MSKHSSDLLPKHDCEGFNWPSFNNISGEWEIDGSCGPLEVYFCPTCGIELPRWTEAERSAYAAACQEESEAQAKEYALWRDAQDRAGLPSDRRAHAAAKINAVINQCSGAMQELLKKGHV